MTYPAGFRSPKEQARDKKLVRKVAVLIGVLLGLTFLIQIISPDTRPTFDKKFEILGAFYGV
jgi:hypothetical protein